MDNCRSRTKRNPPYIQVARMPRLIQQDFSEERRGQERMGVGQGETGGRLAVGRKKERGEWEG